MPRSIDCHIRVFIDDFDVSDRVPTNRQVARALAHTAHSRVQSLDLGEGVLFSPPKATVDADSPALACHIRAARGPRGGMACTNATVLGVDATGGRSRCAARRSTRALRFARCHNRRTRPRRITAAFRMGRAMKFFVADIRPAATYGAEITGVAPGALRHRRQLAANTFRPRARGRSLSAVRLLHGDPAGRTGHAAAARWALESRRATAHHPYTLSVPYLTNAFYLARSVAISST